MKDLSTSPAPPRRRSTASSTPSPRAEATNTPSAPPSGEVSTDSSKTNSEPPGPSPKAPARKEKGLGSKTRAPTQKRNVESERRTRDYCPPFGDGRPLIFFPPS